MTSTCSEGAKLRQERVTRDSAGPRFGERAQLAVAGTVTVVAVDPADPTVERVVGAAVGWVAVWSAVREVQPVAVRAATTMAQPRRCAGRGKSWSSMTAERKLSCRRIFESRHVIQRECPQPLPGMSAPRPAGVRRSWVAHGRSCVAARLDQVHPPCAGTPAVAWPSNAALLQDLGGTRFNNSTPENPGHTNVHQLEAPHY